MAHRHTGTEPEIKLLKSFFPPYFLLPTPQPLLPTPLFYTLTKPCYPQPEISITCSGSFSCTRLVGLGRRTWCHGLQSPSKSTCYIELHCFVHIVINFFLFYFIELYCFALYFIFLYFIVLYCIVLYRIVLYCIVLHCITLHSIVLYSIV